MSFLLRTETAYRLCYGEPKRPYIITSNGSYFCANEFQKMVESERCAEIHETMESENVPIDGWADVCQNNRGLLLSIDIAEYLLAGKTLAADTYIEILTNP
jgi:hypothetical protein